MAGAPLLTLNAQHPDSSAIDRAAIDRAAALLREGKLVAFPTETVYGLGANALDPDAVAAIYAAKGRPAWNPVIVHVADVAAAQALTRAWPVAAQRLADAFWPGPLTLVLPKASHVPDIATAGLDAVAVLIPAHHVALALLRAAGVPIAAPSANRFTRLSPTTAQHVHTSLGERVDLILDGGPCEIGIESTVVQCLHDTALVLRPGMIAVPDLERALAGSGISVRMAAPTVSHDQGESAAAQPAPGAADRHYAPRADVWLFDPAQQAEIAAALHARHADTPVQALLRTTTLPLPPLAVVQMPDAPHDYARLLYATLHAADAIGVALIVIEQPPDEPQWAGLRDRITRASR